VKKRFFKRLGGKRRGFTLIELLIVLSILAVLAAVVVLALTGFIGRGEEAACESDEMAVQTAVYSYYYENDGSWPTTGGGDAADIDFALLVPGYLNETPDSDTNNVWGVDTGGVVCTKGLTPDCGTACTGF